MRNPKEKRPSNPGWCDPVIVVGTTPDYVARIVDHYDGAVLFLLDSRFMGDPFLREIDPFFLFFTPFENDEEIMENLDEYLFHNKISPKGIACFDCEYLVLASRLAARRGLAFPPLEAVLHTRNKLETRRILMETRLGTVSATPASGIEDTLDFFRHSGKDIVIKPITGSGAELIFHCRTEEEVRESVEIMEKQLPKRRLNPLYLTNNWHSSGFITPDTCKTWVVEEHVAGPEYSCDFILSHEHVTIIRETAKLKAPDQPFGSMLAYICPPSYPATFSREAFRDFLKRVATALGFSWGYFMADFIVHDGYPFIIEISPRPGGDSIPDLMKKANGLDTIGIYLDMTSGKPIIFQQPSFTAFMGSLNLYATSEGILTKIDMDEVWNRSWVKGIHLKKKVGDRITLPPQDYDNRLLGYFIVSLKPRQDPIELLKDLQNHMFIAIEN